MNTTKLLTRYSRTAIGVGGLLLGLALIAGFSAMKLKASDHDDGETELKGRNLNLTDLYVFREKDQNPSAADGNLIFIMNTNPRSVARQQYYFSTNARYTFNVSRVTDRNATPTGKPDVVLQFEFGAPNANGRQDVKLTATWDGARCIANQPLYTTPLNTNPNIGQASLCGNSTVNVFAGLREDPFFFDVEQFFRVRAGAIGIGPAVGFREPRKAIDFAKGYNVNAIAVRIPKSLLQGRTSAQTFDVWQTISFKGTDGKFTQVERLARPAINEGLVVANDNLNALNSVGPDFEAAALAGQQPAATQAAPIIADVKRTLKGLGNNDARVNALLGAFLPDVMRIDTTVPSGYGTTLNTKGSPISGRKLTDDVMDTTLSVLTNGAVTSDNVSYAGRPLNPAQGHQPLVSSFPYLAPAN